MSLLIKALASAEKDKQKAEKPERSEPITADTLSLSPLDLQSETTAEAATGDEETFVDGNAMQFTLSPENRGVHESESSLAEEAGLMSSDIPVKQSVVTKSNTAPAKAVSKPKSKTDAFNEAAMASVASNKAQGNSVKESNQRVAAGAFVANQAAKTHSSRSALILLGVAGALLILLGLQGYQYFQNLFKDEVVVIKPVAQQSVPSPAPVVNANLTEGNVVSEGVAPTEVAEDASASKSAASEAEVNAAVSRLESQINAEVKKGKLEKQGATTEPESSVFDNGTTAEASRLSAQSVTGSVVKAAPEKNTPRESRAPAQREPLKLVSKTPVAGVDPTLLGAYESFTRGDDRLAQQRYRQVLQKDVRNIDALLGMAAIAQRQNRTMDAIGWYRKVTEIEPRNSIAQSAMADLEATTDAVGAESKIKSLLVRQPDAANLHAALGNLYAEQNQWSAAQAAYFNASQYAPNSADYAFNLAISLEHLGKSELALVQYQRALDLRNATDAISPDRAQLEARIQALQ